MTVGRARRAGFAGDQGSGTIWMLAFGLLVVLCGLVGFYRGSAAVVRHRAESAADLAALAGAARVLDGPTAACRQAAAIATANGAQLVQCRLDGADVSVSAVVRFHGPVPGRPAAQGWARAGPAAAAAPASGAAVSAPGRLP